MCKQCFSDYKKERYRADPGPTLTKCREYKASHKEEVALRNQEYRETHRAEEVVRAAVWAKANPVSRLESQQRRRARKRGSQVAKITPKMLEGRLAVFGGTCAYCKVGPFQHWDHVKPLELGGPHILSNLRPSCAKCNIRKGKIPAMKWLLSLPRV